MPNVKKYTYAQAENMARKIILEQENLSPWCVINDISYQTVIRIKNSNTKNKYPKVITKILNSAGYDVIIEDVYIISKSKKLKSHDGRKSKKVKRK